MRPDQAPEATGPSTLAFDPTVETWLMTPVTNSTWMYGCARMYGGYKLEPFSYLSVTGG